MNNKQSERKYKITINVSGTQLTYNNCVILKEEEDWLTFIDKFGNEYKVNKNSITILEVLK